MKKILCLIAFSALTAFAKQSYRLTGGVNLSSISYNFDDYTTKTDNITGYHINFISDMSLASFISFQSGVVFSLKGGEYSGEPLNTNYELYYLQTPFTLSLRFPINETIVLRAGAGLYVASGLFGSVKTGSSERDAFGGDFNYFDAGLTYSGGVEFYSFYVGIIYENGLANISNLNYVNKATNKTLGFTIGYIFK